MGVAASASPASAQVEAGVTVGFHDFSNTNQLGVANGASGTSEHNGGLFGLRGGLMFTDVLGIEAESGFIPTESRLATRTSVLDLVYRGDIIAQFRADHASNIVLPFVLAGFGGESLISTNNKAVLKKDTNVELFAGLGAKFRLDHDLGIRLDGRILFPPSSRGDSVAVDFEALVSFYKEWGRWHAAAAEPSGPKDTDGDGITDDKDKCPTIAEDKDGFQDEDGCPDPDNDGDGIADAQDKCPNQPETKNGYQDEDGCPDEIPEALKKFMGSVQGVNFKLNSAELLASSYKTLDAAVAVFKQFPTVGFEIGGHTDDQPMGKGGKYPDNDALSQARADSVKAYLVKKGIPENRMTTHGYGSTVPAVDPTGLKGGKLAEARAKNRRVEIKLTGTVPGMH